MQDTKKAYRRGRRPRAVVLIMVLGILATMMIVATAFLVFMRQSYRAATNAQFGARAEIAARSGLEHAIRAISFAVDAYTVTPDGALDSHGEFFDDPAGTAPNGSPVGPGAGWYKYFEGATEIVRYTDSGDPKPHVITGRRFQVGTPTVQMEYAVRVYDLDGRLHANIAKWTDGQASTEAELRARIESIAIFAGLPPAEQQAFSARSAGVPFSCNSEMARAGNVTDVAMKYALETYFCSYPFYEAPVADSATAFTPVDDTTEVALQNGGLTAGSEIGKVLVFDISKRGYWIVDNEAGSVTVTGDCVADNQELDAVVIKVPRPALNVNTAPEALLSDLIEHLPSVGTLANKAIALSRYVIASRPFAGRHDFEEAVRSVSGDDGIVSLCDYNPDLPTSTPHLDENQFNDFLNSTAGVLAEEDSTYDEPGNPGVYSFDGWAPFNDEPASDPNDDDGTGPQQTGGDHTAPDGTASNDTGVPTHNVTWSTEFKFTSRFFHIYVLGRGVNPDSGRPRGVRRLHAIYDAEADRILWLRWNISSRGSVVDIQ